MLELLLALAVGALLAYANGANDISKSIATLVGSGVGRYSSAVLWGTLWTAIGATLATITGGAMLATFGTELLNAAAVPPAQVTLGTLIGASAWIILATRTGLPVSTTHALIGSLVGVFWWTQGAGAVRWDALGSKIFLPLLLSPLAALALTGIIRPLIRRSAGDRPSDCLCIETIPRTVTTTASVAAFAPGSGMLIGRGRIEECTATCPGALKVTVDHLHWLTSGATAFARGLNDAPKLVALIAATTMLPVQTTLPLWLLFALDRKSVV